MILLEFLFLNKKQTFEVYVLIHTKELGNFRISCETSANYLAN